MFDFLFKRKPANPEPAVKAPPAAARAPETGVAPGTQLHFDASLVTALVSDHRYLLAMFKEIAEATTRRDNGVVSRALAQFGDARAATSSRKTSGSTSTSSTACKATRTARPSCISSRARCTTSAWRSRTS